MMNQSVRIKCLTGVGETGANAYLVQVGSWSLLLDAGASNPSCASWVEHLGVQPDVVWISHVHADHIGALSRLRKRFPGLRVLMTPQSAGLLPAALRHEDRRGGGSTGEALQHLIEPLAFNRTRELRHDDSDCVVRLTPYRSGHMLGSASLHLEILVADKFHGIFYLPDFSAHALSMTARAEFPLHDEEARIDVLLMEGMLGADRPSDRVDFDDELAALVRRITSEERPGGQLLALAALGESCEIAHALVMSGALSRELVVHDFLRPVFDAYEFELPEETSWAALGVRFATQTECQHMMMAGGVVIAPGEHLDEGTPAFELARRVWGDPLARIVVLNSVRKKSVAGRLLRAEAGVMVTSQGVQEEVAAEIVHALLPTHAPRWALKGVVKALKPRHVWLVHGQRASLSALAKALRVQQQGRAWGAEITIPERGAVLTL